VDGCYRVLRLTSCHPAIDTAIADPSRCGHVGPGPEACLFFDAQLGKERFVGGPAAGLDRSSACRPATGPAFFNEWLEGRPYASCVGGVDVDFIRLSVQGEEDGFVGVSPFNIVRQFDYHRLCHESIMTEHNDLSEF
jgi:hypothetical protein